MTLVGIRKCLLFSIRSCWRFVCQHPFVSGLLLFMLFLYRYFPSIFSFLIYYSPVIACTSLLLGALLVYGEPDITERKDAKSVDISSIGEWNISAENFRSKGSRNVTSDGSFKQLHEGNTIKKAEDQIHSQKSVFNEALNPKFFEKHVFSVENPGLKVGIVKPSDNNIESSLGSPWQQVNDGDATSGSESDGEESSSSPDASLTDIVPIIDELNPLLESSENPLQGHRSVDSFDTESRVSSSDHAFDDCSAEEETENQADEEDEEAQEEKDNSESIVKWTADDEKNLMDLGSSELERNRRLENLIAKRRAKKLQRFQTDKNLIDLDTEPLQFMEEISRFNVQIPSISAPRHNPFDLPYDSEESRGLLPVPGSAPSVLLPRQNPFDDLPYEQEEESNKLGGESSRPYDNKPNIKPYFVVEKDIGKSFGSFERQLSEKSDSKESSGFESDSVSAVVNRDHELSESETHERVLSPTNRDVETVDQQSDLSVQIGSEQEQNIADTVEQEIGEIGSSSPVSSTTNSDMIDERYDGSSSSPCSEEHDKYMEPVKPALPVKGAEGADDIHIADPVYDSSPSAMSTVSHIPHLDEDLFSKFKGKEGSSLARDMEEDNASDEISYLSGIQSVKDLSNSVKSEVPRLESSSSEQLVNRMEDSYTEKSEEQPRATESDTGPSQETLASSVSNLQTH